MFQLLLSFNTTRAKSCLGGQPFVMAPPMMRRSLTSKRRGSIIPWMVRQAIPSNTHPNWEPRQLSVNSRISLLTLPNWRRTWVKSSLQSRAQERPRISFKSAKASNCSSSATKKTKRQWRRRGKQRIYSIYRRCIRAWTSRARVCSNQWRGHWSK